MSLHRLAAAFVLSFAIAACLRPPPQSADYNADGRVDLLDFSTFSGLYGTRGDVRADLNLDGLVNEDDVAEFRRQFARSQHRYQSPLPRP